MTVKEILKLAATLLDDKNCFDYLDGKVPDDSQAAVYTAERLLCAYNLVIEELAVEYFPLKEVEKIACSDGVLSTAHLSKNAVRIVCVRDENYNKLGYKLINDHLELEKNVPFAIVEYEYRPNDFALGDNFCYDLSVVGKYAVCFGMLSEYLLEKGCVSEAKVWNEKYVNAIKNRLAPKKNLKLPKRRWC